MALVAVLAEAYVQTGSRPPCGTTIQEFHGPEHSGPIPLSPERPQSGIEKTKTAAPGGPGTHGAKTESGPAWGADRAEGRATARCIPKAFGISG